MDLRQGLVDLFIGFCMIVSRLRTDHRGGKDNVLVVKVRVEAGDGGIRLELLPQAHDNDQGGDSANRGEAEPHELLANGPARLCNVTHAVQCGVLEKLLRLVNETATKDDQGLNQPLPRCHHSRVIRFLIRHFRFRNIARELNPAACRATFATNQLSPSTVAFEYSRPSVVVIFSYCRTKSLSLFMH